MHQYVFKHKCLSTPIKKTLRPDIFSIPLYTTHNRDRESLKSETNKPEGILCEHSPKESRHGPY